TCRRWARTETHSFCFLNAMCHGPSTHPFFFFNPLFKLQMPKNMHMPTDTTLPQRLLPRIFFLGCSWFLPLLVQVFPPFFPP
uniref:Uncharacterized protein n=1 Tax=Neovison vison TaxID=452646 RepID=A0A8C7B329_NEOVI